MFKNVKLNRCCYFFIVLCLCLALHAELFAQGRVLFVARREVPSRDGTSVGPVALASGRFRGPSFPLDLAVTNEFSSDISVLYGDGRGGFHFNTVYSGFDHPFHIIARDFNNDEILDLAAANFSDDVSNTFISILLGNSDNPGTFSAPTNYRVPDAGATVAAGDFDNDGFLDLAVAVLGYFDEGIYGCDTPCESNRTIAVFINNGDGTFREPAGEFPVGCAPEGIAVGDLRGNGQLDVVTANLFSCSMSILFGDGRGGFSAPTFLPVGERPSTAVIADFNNDGKPDIVTINEMTRSVSILLGDGEGNFALSSDCQIPSGLRIVAADLNQDGYMDIVVAGGMSGTVFVLLGDGQGHLLGCPIESDVTPPAFAAGSLIANLTVGDFNGDNVPDIVVANKGAFEPPAAGSVSVLTGDGLGNLGNFLKLRDTPAYVAVEDLNSDGNLDLVIAQPESNSVRVLLGDGFGGFTPDQALPVGARAVAIAIGDLNNDQKPDIVTTNFGSNDVSVLLANGDGTFQPAIPTPVGAQTPNSVAVGDFDCDGNQDLAIASPSSNIVRILYGNGNGTFTRTRSLIAEGMLEPLSIVKEDFNGDRIPDLAVANRSSNNVSIFLADGCDASSGFLAAPNMTLPPGASPTFITAGDFNGDGKTDIAVANIGLNTVSISFGDGEGTFGSVYDLPAGIQPTSLTVGDYNGDGLADLAVANFGSADVSVFLGQSDGTLLQAPGSPFFAGIGPISIAMGNFDNRLGDMRPDLVIVNWGSSTVSLLLNNGE